MNQTIDQISPEIVALIESQARMAGLSVDEYLRSLVEQKNGTSRPVTERLSREERLAALHEWANSHDSSVPALALEDISRETIY